MLKYYLQPSRIIQVLIVTQYKFTLFSGMEAAPLKAKNQDLWLKSLH